MISFFDQNTSVTVGLGESVTIRLQEDLNCGLEWSEPTVDSDGIVLTENRHLSGGEPDETYREFVFDTFVVGRYTVSSFLKQKGKEPSVKQFFMIIDVLEKSLKS